MTTNLENCHEKKALITLCTVAATLVAGVSYAEGGQGAGGAGNGERGFKAGLYNNTPRLDTWQTDQAAMTPYNNMNNNDSYTYSAAQQKTG